ncbi:hypothetical protein BGX21_006561 [Mortierella sp. AD011]|nr:hypothetical protein BGX21_006561 [Mortierella sp. AD011]
MTLTDAWCNTQPTNAQWQAEGEDKVLTIKVGGHKRKAYRTGSKVSKRGIVAIHDPLGRHPTIFQVYDVNYHFIPFVLRVILANLW